MAGSHHRRIYLVDRSFQLKYILLLMGWGVVLAGLFGPAQFLEAVDAMREREARHLALLEEVVAALREALPRAPELVPPLEALQAEMADRRGALAEAAAPPAATPGA